jgi:hypothetical protein
MIMNAVSRRFRAAGGFFSRRSVSQRTLGRACAVLFAAMLIPLVAIAPFNYPADDDFGYTLPAATAWVETHSLPAVFQAIVEKTKSIYAEWQGDFVSSFLFAVNPLIFNIDLYFLSNWFILALLCLSAGYLVGGVTAARLSAPRPTFWIVYTALMVLILQFMPSIGNSVYWHNGGQYTVTACVLMLALGLLLRCGAEQSAAGKLVRGALLALCGFVLGGSFYGPALGAFVILALVTAVSHVRRSPVRWPATAALAAFCVAFAISIAAPGNALRQGRTGETASVAFTLVTTLLDSFDLAGKWLTPQLFAMLMLIVPVLWKPLKNSAFRFGHPFFIALSLYGMFAASLAPGIYTGFGYETERYLNAIYLYFLIAALGGAVYAEGWLIRYLEGKRETNGAAEASPAAAFDPGRRFTALYLTLCITLLALGGFAYTIMNTSSVSAAKSLVTGEAAAFRNEMKEREEYIRVTDSDVTSVAVLGAQPHVFKQDKLPFQGIYGRIRYMKWYFELFYNAGSP